MKNEQPTRQGSFWSNYIFIKVDVSDIRSVTVGMLSSLKKPKSIKKYSVKYEKSFDLLLV